MKDNRWKGLQMFSWFLPPFFFFFKKKKHFLKGSSITILPPFPPYMPMILIRANLTGVGLLLVGDTTSALTGWYDRYTRDFLVS